MSEQPTYCACGCALSEGDAVCPLCGEPVRPNPSAAIPFAAPISSPPRGAPSVSEVATRKRGRRTLAIVGAVAGALTVAGLALGVVSAWSADANLKDRASRASEKNEGVVEARTLFEPGLGSAAGNLAGGGIALPEGDALYLADSDGIFYLEAVSSEGDAMLQGVTSDRASSLNGYENALYYLASSGNASFEPGSGTSVRKVDDPLRNLGRARSSEVLYRAESGVLLANLAVHDGWMYFTAGDDEGFSVLEMPCDASSAPREVKRFDAERCWVFVEADTLYAVSSSASSWSVEQRPLDGNAASFSPLIAGEGRLRAACFHEGALYYAVDEAAGTSPLRMKDAKGGYKEYPEVADGVRIAASGEVVAVLGEAGSLHWIDVSTGFVHDESWMVADGLGGANPATVGLGLYDEWLCARNDQGDYLQFNVNSGEIWAGGPSAKHLPDALDADAAEPTIVV